MGNITLSFSLDRHEESQEIKNILNSENMHVSIISFREYLRQVIKYSDKSKEEMEAAESIQAAYLEEFAPFFDH